GLQLGLSSKGSTIFHGATLQIKLLNTRDLGRCNAQTTSSFVLTREPVCFMQMGAARHKGDFKKLWGEICEISLKVESQRI
ncbi:mCG145303, partial [Mus musculus]